MPTSGKSVYIHIPFCSKKCPYCCFYSVYPNNHFLEHYMSSLLKEIKQAGLEKEKIISVYFGGGTPSLLTEKNLYRILNAIPSISDSTEITLEMNPNDAHSKKIKEIGINRVSLGIQSFNDDELISLGRTHNTEKGIQAVENIYNSGISNISVDILYDIPKQTEKSFEHTLNTTVSLPISHISLYNLTFEKNTPFYKNKKKLQPLLPSNKKSLILLKKATAFFSQNKFKRYEISAFAKKGCSSIHNIGYWTAREFLGFGPSAFSYKNKKRYKNIPDIKKYIEYVNNGDSPVCFEEKLCPSNSLKELLTIGLRMTKGINIKGFQKKHGRFPDETEAALDFLVKNGFLKKTSNKIKLTAKGFLFYDYIAENLV